ncbi:hypothetical protein ACKWTF_016105 [Chironomus riparius]
METVLRNNINQLTFAVALEYSKSKIKQRFHLKILNQLILSLNCSTSTKTPDCYCRKLCGRSQCNQHPVINKLKK